MAGITLRKWLEENELHLDTPVAEEIIDTVGDAYLPKKNQRHLASRGAVEWWVCPLLIVETNPTGTHVLDEDAESQIREWLDRDGDRMYDMTKPDRVIYS